MAGQSKLRASNSALPTKTSLPKSTRTLPHIPPEVSRLLSSHLDLSSAARLMRTCRGLQDAGEMKLYSRLDMTGSLTRMQAHLAANVNPIYHPIDAASFRLRANIIDEKLQRTLSALGTHPYRVGYVNELRLEPSDGPPPHRRAKALFKLVGLVSGRIQRLDILPFRTRHVKGEAERNEFGCQRFYDALEIGDYPFPRLLHLVLGFTGKRPGEPLAGWMGQMTNLRSLHFCSAKGWYDLPGMPLPSIGPFLGLQSLTFSNLHDLDNHFAVEILGELLALAPNLETLRLRGQWQPRREDLALAAIGRLKNLKRIIAVDDDFEQDEVEEGIEYSRFGKVELAIEEGVVDSPAWTEAEEVTVEYLPIPNAPHLRRLTLNTLPRCRPLEYASISVGPDHYHTMRLHPHCIHHLRRAPILTTLLYLYQPDLIAPAFVPDPPELELFVAPSRWAEEGHRGMIVRQYRNAGDEDEELWHVRTLSRGGETAAGQEYVGLKRAWRDLTFYKGLRVPRPILEKVYGELGEKPNFIEGGRELDLGPTGGRAWEILRKWRSGMEDPVEEDWDTMDDDLDSDDED